MIHRHADLGDHNPYRAIDIALDQWAVAKGAQISTYYKDSEVRSFDKGRYQIWIEPPAEDGNVTAKVWRRDNVGSISFTTDARDLPTSLDQAWRIALEQRPTGQPLRATPRWIKRFLKWFHLDKP